MIEKNQVLSDNDKLLNTWFRDIAEPFVDKELANFNGTPKRMFVEALLRTLNFDLHILAIEVIKRRYAISGKWEVKEDTSGRGGRCLVFS